MSLEALLERDDFHRVVLQESDDGVYVFMYERRDSQEPERDYLQDSVELAISFCEEYFQIPPTAWKDV